MFKIHARWFSAKPQENYDEITAGVLASQPTFELLKEIIDRKLSNSKEQQADYDKTSWAYHMADQLGYTRALTEVLDLITIKDK